MDEYLSHNFSKLPIKLLIRCITKAYYLRKTANGVPRGGGRQLLRTLMSVNLTWFKITEELLIKTDSKRKATYGGNQSRSFLDGKNKSIPDSRPIEDISVLTSAQMPPMDGDITPLIAIKGIRMLRTMLEKAKDQNLQLKELLSLKESERLLLEEKLNGTLKKTSDMENMLLEADKKIKSLELLFTHTRKEIEVTKMQLLEAREAAKLGEEIKAMFKVAQTGNIRLKEEMEKKNNEILQLEERAVSAEELAKQSQHQLNCFIDDAQHEKQLLDRTLSENLKLHNDKKQLATENDLLKKETDQLKAELNLQLKMIEDQKGDSGKRQEKTTVEGHDNNDGPSGYPRDIFTGEVDDKYLCTRCRWILKNPIQSFCGHRFCKDCFDCLIRKDGGQAICQRCSEECDDAAENTLEQSKTFPDNAIRRELNSMRANCVFEKCKWSGSFKEYEEHFEKCDWRPCRCDTCGEHIPKNELEGHKCRSSNLYGGQECKYQCGKPVTGLDFALHLKQLLPEHFEALFRRMEIVTSLVSTNSLAPDRKGTLYDWIITIENLVKSLEDRTQKQLESSAAKETNSSVGKTKISEGGTVERERAASAATGGSGPGVAVEGPSASDVIQKLAKLSADMKTCESLLTSLDREVEHDFNIVENLQANEAALKRNLEGLAQTLKSMDRVLSLKNASLADLDKRVSDLEQTNYDGSLLWQLTDFQWKRQEAIAGRTTSIYSPPFYTSKTGYKMCARLYLNGDGMGRGTHVSLFFVIMRGQYDALLKWPFRQKVTLMFLDQSGKDQHVMDAFRPDPNSSSFKRPTTEMNIASGCPLFMSLMQLDNPLHTFVKDDTAFIKIVISREEI